MLGDDSSLVEVASVQVVNAISGYERERKLFRCAYEKAKEDYYQKHKRRKFYFFGDYESKEEVLSVKGDWNHWSTYDKVKGLMSAGVVALGLANPYGDMVWDQHYHIAKAMVDMGSETMYLSPAICKFIKRFKTE